MTTGIKLDFKITDAIVLSALEEDLNDTQKFGKLTGDRTNAKLKLPGIAVTAEITAHEDCVLAGVGLMERVFNLIDSSALVTVFHHDGSLLKKNTIISKIRGKDSSLLTSERTALNFVQHLSGIATNTKKYVDIAKDHGVAILDTRKTSPGLRYLQKYAVRCGGGENHRFGLFDRIFIKDNHISVYPSLSECIKNLSPDDKQEAIIEVTELSQLKESIALGMSNILLDNMSIEEMIAARSIAGPDIYLEASGGINLDNIEEVASSGINAVSIGNLTHSVKAIDFSMELVKD